MAFTRRLLAVLLVAGMAQPMVWAGDYGDCADCVAAPEETSRLGKAQAGPALKKLGRGLANFIGSPLEIPATISDHTRATEDSVANFFVGTALGLGNMVLRATVGVYETFTFFIPERQPILPTLRYFHVDRDKPKV